MFPLYLVKCNRNVRKLEAGYLSLHIVYIYISKISNHLLFGSRKYTYGARLLPLLSHSYDCVRLQFLLRGTREDVPKKFAISRRH